MSEIKYVPLPGARSKVWKFFGFKTKDGHNIDPDHKEVVFCTGQGGGKSVPYLRLLDYKKIVFLIFNGLTEQLIFAVAFFFAILSLKFRSYVLLVRTR